MFTLVSDHVSVKIDTHITKLVVKMISCFLIEMQKRNPIILMMDNTETKIGVTILYIFMTVEIICTLFCKCKRSVHNCKGITF